MLGEIDRAIDLMLAIGIPSMRPPANAGGNKNKPNIFSSSHASFNEAPSKCWGKCGYWRGLPH